tara:strand:- start:357 stop:695 length:339 start_codon:yes stop_codon:yes gene_type:complete
MNTIDIAIGDDRGQQTGTKTVRARPTPIPGLTITGDRGDYKITHVRSGRRVCYASLYNFSASLDKIRNAMMIASGIDVVCSTVVDWTVDGAHLPKRQCEDWIRAFAGALAHS